MKKFIVLSIVLLMLAGFAITSSAIFSRILWAGQNEEVGMLTVEVTGKNLVVTFIIDAPWVLEETHLYVVKGLDNTPAKSAPGQFPYGPDDAVGGVYTIPLADLSAKEGDILCIAAHAEVTNSTEEETAWAEGCPIPPGKNWAMYFNFKVQ